MVATVAKPPLPGQVSRDKKTGHLSGRLGDASKGEGVQIDQAISATLAFAVLNPCTAASSPMA